LKKTRLLIGKIFAAVLILFAISVPFMSSASATYKPSVNTIPPTTVFLSPSRIEGTAGQNITIYAEITDVNLMMGYQLGLVWSNTAVAQCTKVTNGSIVNQLPSDQFTIVPAKINNTIGLIKPFGASAYSPYTMNGSGGLVAFTFHIIQTGYSDVHINNMFLIDPSVFTIPCNTVDYFTTVAGGQQYITRLQGNPLDSSGQAGFGAMSVEKDIQTINSFSYQGNMTFKINGTSDDCGTFAYFNVTIPNDLMNCTNQDYWIVEVDGVIQSGVLVNLGSQNATISLGTDSDPSFVYTPHFGGTRTHTIQIFSNNTAVPEFASTFSSMLLATLLLLVAFATGLFSIAARSRKLRLIHSSQV